MNNYHEAYDLEGELKVSLELACDFEGFKEDYYLCPAGYKTIGHGRNCEAYPLTDDEPYPMTVEYSKEWTLDFLKTERRLAIAKWPWLVTQPPSVRIIITDMAFNLGISKLSRFRKMLAAIAAGSYLEAAEELKDSLYYVQTGRRAKTHYESLKYLGA